MHIEAVKRPHVIGYVTKYLMKSLSQSEKGSHQVKRERYVYTKDEEGKAARKKAFRLVEVVSSARRIRYSRQFFPESVADLRVRLFSSLEATAMEKENGAGESAENGKLLEDTQPPSRSSWVLYEQEEISDDLDEQMRWHREALIEALSHVRDGKRRLSRRVISMWDYQRRELKKGR